MTTSKFHDALKAADDAAKAIRTTLEIKRRQLPPLETSGPNDETLWSRHDTYAEVTSGSITAEVLRFAFWGGDDQRPVEVSFEVRMNGMPEDGGGTCELYATEPAHLLDLAAVCGAAAMLLDEARQGDRSEVGPPA